MSAWELIKYGAFNGSERLGVNRLIQRSHRKDLLIVLYHGVISAPKDPLGYCVHAGEFEEQIATLSRRFHPISLADLIAAIEGRAHLPERAVLVTFDDGYRNNLTHAAPILLRHGVPAVIHVATGYIGTGRILWVEEIRLRMLHWTGRTVPMPGGEPDVRIPGSRSERVALADRVSQACKNLLEPAKEAYLARLREVSMSFGEDYVEEAFAFLSWDEVRKLRSLGFEIGSHTINHPILSALGADDLNRELIESKRVIEEQLSGPCLCIGYPNGRSRDVSDAVIECARQAGYKTGFLLMDRFNRSLASPLTLTRVNILGYLPPCVFHSRISGLSQLWR
jgi:peptidoglycan/xylan/chitin deacetylase (PgdA/CDA1 family)